MTGPWGLALSGARAHRAGLSGTALVLAAAGAVVSMVGVLLESGLRAAPGVDGGLLTALASSYAGTALVVVLLVTATTVTLALRGRRRELALLRTVGATRGQVRQQVSREVLLVAGVAVPLGALPGVLLARRLVPLLVDAGVLAPGGELAISPLPALGAVALLLPTALLAGRLAARETLRSSPTEAVRDSAHEAPGIGGVRRWLAVAGAVAGLAAAFSPLVVPGTIGAASAATSAFLLVAAACLAGPLLVAATFGRASRLPGARTGAPTRLALHNLRGYSRRLTTVVVPLALALATGTIQTSVDRSVAEAAGQQLTAALGADLVVTGATTPDRVREATALPGLARVVPLTDTPAEVRTDSDDLPDGLVWERTSLRAVPADVPRDVLDPGVTEGSLAALAEPGTVAVSSDAAFELGLDLGDAVPVRVEGAEHRLDVVAVYDRGLGLGDYLTDTSTVAALGGAPAATTLLVDADDPAATGALRGLELGVATAEGYAASVVSADAALQRLSTVLLLALLVFVGLGAATALVLSTAGRRAELALLHRTGATRRQLVRMTLVESVLTGLLAWVIGTAAVVPAVVGVSAGLLGWHLPVVDLPTYALLSGAVLVTSVAATVGAATWAVRLPRGRTAAA
ncbi:FtsX-like permease family protein [Nocardioides sp. SYSU D00038]|uniref:FtsX-like permease family protein n=1 Tax=Nocardioides sp. SYSU D00038 TaxID=2812554 RepID=UPI00196849BD|nr:ABC transporter permease [Nocardioides sp. SYSU D00038]